MHKLMSRQGELKTPFFISDIFHIVAFPLILWLEKYCSSKKGESTLKNTNDSLALRGGWHLRAARP